MTATILTAVFILLAGVCKAVADTLQHHFQQSVFKWWDPRFWDGAVSWQYAHYLKFTRYKIDGWHIANSLMILFFCLAIAFHKTGRFDVFLEVIMYGGLFDIAFNIFYNKILKKK
jgi:hypothetical protein